MRRNVSILTLLIIGLGVGYLIKNVKVGLILGLVIGLLISGIGTKSK
ncbi:MAG: hypothetical protein K9G06_00920 [Chitinophagaceae bacterium]|jgi:hypothetical protein|nr:hypothetical protein [Chitinophagaceae bacterium]